MNRKKLPSYIYFLSGYFSGIFIMSDNRFNFIIALIPFLMLIPITYLYNYKPKQRQLKDYF